MISEYFFFVYICFSVLVCAVYFSIVRNKWMLLFAPPLHLLAFDTVFYFLHIESERTLISIFFFSFLITMSGLVGSFYEASRLNSINNSLAWDPTSLLKRKTVETAPVDSGRSWDRAYLILGGVGVMLFYYILSSADVSILTLMTNKAEFARFYSGSRRGGAWMLLLVNSLAFGQIYIFFKSKKNWHGLGCILFMVILSMQGGRGILMSYIMMLLMIKMWHTGSGRAIPAMVSVAALVFVLASFLRTGNLDEYVNSRSVFYDFNLAHVYEECRAYVDENGTEWGLFTSDVVLYIPRAFWPDKPMSTAETLLIYPDVALSGTSYTFGLYGNSLLHMNHLGIVIICLFYAGLGVAFIRFDTKEISAGGAFIFITFLSMELLWLRGGMFAVRAATVAGTSLIGWKAAEFFSRTAVQRTFIPVKSTDGRESEESRRRAA